MIYCNEYDFNLKKTYSIGFDIGNSDTNVSDEAKFQMDSRSERDEFRLKTKQKNEIKNVDIFLQHNEIKKSTTDITRNKIKNRFLA